MNKITVLLIGCLLTACASQQDILKLYDASCQEKGFKPQTEAHFNCTVQLEQLRLQRIKTAGDAISRSQPHYIYQNTYKY